MIELKKGRKSPRDGYLLNKKEYALYKKDMELLDLIEEELHVSKELKMNKKQTTV